jgi:FkbM family methyltransferase
MQRGLRRILRLLRKPGTVLRFWRNSLPFRARFGQVAGLQLANNIADVSYRSPDGSVVPVKVPGWRDPLWMRTGTTDVDVFCQVVIGRELEFDIPAPRRILDGGANIGIASRVFADRWPDAAVVAVEFEPANHAMLLRNCAAHPRIQARWAALWNECGQVSVAAGENGEWGFQVDSAKTGLADVSAITIEQLLDDLGWESVDLVKLDIEGAEREVLATASRWLPRVNHLVVELHERFAPGCVAAFEAAIDRRQWSVRPHGEYLVASRLEPR